MKEKIENKLNEYVEYLLSKTQLTCEEYIVLKRALKEMILEEQEMRKAEARANKVNSLFNS